MVQSAAPAKSSREERKEREASKHVQPPGTISAEEIAARLPLEREMESVTSLVARTLVVELIMFTASTGDTSGS